MKILNKIRPRTDSCLISLDASFQFVREAGRGHGYAAGLCAGEQMEYQEEQIQGHTGHTELSTTATTGKTGELASITNLGKKHFYSEQSVAPC